MNKNEVRSIIRQRINKMSDEEKQYQSAEIQKELEQLTEFKTAQVIFIYWSLTGEVSTHELIQKWFTEKKLFLPTMVGEKLEMRLFTGMDQMQMASRFKILQSTGRLVLPDEKPDLIVVPGLAFDVSGKRLGRGAGFYDRFLKNHPDAYKVGIAYDVQCVDNIPVESHDVTLNKVIFGQKKSLH
jgi:5-formyltetrahydrofolate cyclo-ligase